MPPPPSDPKGKSPDAPNPAEDRELLKLVGAVLETTRKRKERKRFAAGMLQRLRRAKTVALRGTKKKPAVAICVVVSCISLSYVVGMLVTAFASTPIVPRDIRPPGGESTYVGIIKPAPEVKPGPAAPGPPVVHDTEGDDPAKDLLRRIVEGDYERRDQVAMGRFLKEFDDQVMLLIDTDRTKLKPARRGLGWLQLRAPYHISEARWEHRTHLDDYNVLKNATQSHIRMLKDEDVWKVEHIRVY